MDFQGINPDFIVATNEGPSYPWLQATDYQPRNSSAKIQLVLPEDAVELIEPTELSRIDFEPATISTDSGDTTAFCPKNIRWVILAQPRSFKVDKEGKVTTIEKGVKWNGEYKSVARLLLGGVIDDSFVKDAEGSIQIFTLKLKGMKTEFIRASDPEARTISKMNEAICKAFKKRGWMGHLVSVELEVVPRSFKMMGGDQSSWGCFFRFKEGTNARPLASHLQKQVHEFITSEDFKLLAEDPFRINGEKVVIDSGNDFPEMVEDEGIPF